MTEKVGRERHVPAAGDALRSCLWLYGHHQGSDSRAAAPRVPALRLPLGRGDPVTAWLSANDIAVILKRPLGTVHRWASEDGWRRVGTRPMRYSWEDACASVDKRRDTPTAV